MKFWFDNSWGWFMMDFGSVGEDWVLMWMD